MAPVWCFGDAGTSLDIDARNVLLSACAPAAITKDSIMRVETLIREKLTQAFAPSLLAIENESAKHAHHSAMTAGKAQAATGETHFRIKIVSDAFAGKSKVERHRMVYAALAEVMNNPVHALALVTLARDEAA
jgi:BolA protein